MPSSRRGSHSLTLITVGGNPVTSSFVANPGHANGSLALKASIPYPIAPRLLLTLIRMPLFSIDDGYRASGQLPAMYGHSAYRPLMRPRSPSRFSWRPVASVRLPPPLSPLTMTRAGSMPYFAALVTVHRSPDTQSLSPAGKGATSGSAEGTSELRNSTITTTTPLDAMILPH